MYTRYTMKSSKKSRKLFLSQLRRLQQERGRIIRLLTRDEELAWGSVARVHRKCGNPRCRCAAGKGHAQVIFLFKDERGESRRCKLIRKADERRMLKAGDRYRQFRADLKRLYAIENQIRQILVAIMEERAIQYV
jgi:hypothetical protein